MGDSPEDGRCSPDSGDQEVEILEDESYVLDRNDNALEDNDIILNTSDTKREESPEDGEMKEESPRDLRKQKAWLKNTMASVMSLNDDTEKKVEPKRENRRKPQCFNCNGEHNMAACTEPKNFKRIRENRDAFNAARAKDARYTETAQSQNGEFKPGRISDNLRRALGLRSSELPEYIYRMRRMGFKNGYPPGYLKNAIVRQTNPDDLLTFHSDNPELRDDKEEGEADERPLSPSINPEKVIYYFGFNMMNRSVQDREANFRVPPFEEFCQFLEAKVKNDFYEEKKREERKRKTEPLDRGDEKRAKLEDDDCMVLAPPPPPPIISKEEGGEGEVEIKEEEEEKKETPATPATPNTKPRGISLGTPVLQRKNLGDGMKKVPSLEAFSKGIVPFQVEEPTPRTGFLQKMLKKIKDTLG